MSDIRALLVNRQIEVTDGFYIERATKKHSEIEDFLRGILSRLPSKGASQFQVFVEQVNTFESRVREYDDDALRQALFRVVNDIPNKGFTDQTLIQPFAIIREAAKRVLGMRHHDVQLTASRVLLQGKVAEMATGEGKTLAATLAACTVAALKGAVHVVTVNDYLAERDALENKPLYEFFGLSVGTVLQDMQIEERRAQYACDIVYVSNKELTFDYLKDRIAIGNALSIHAKLNQLKNIASEPAILRGLHLAIVDEADSVFIDEARTPLIISETIPDELDEAVYQKALALAELLTQGEDYTKTKDRNIWLTPAGEAKVASLAQHLTGVWNSHLWRKELMQKALSALHLFIRDQHYIVAEDKVQIVDEFTGRVMPDRSWERGLHQMIEAKEGCEISGQRRTLSQVTYQRFFGKYLLLSGMTGTAKEVETELKRVYDISAIKIPTHKKNRRHRLPDRVFIRSEERWQYIAKRIAQLVKQERAVLVGTRSVEASEHLSDLLTKSGVNHQVLNARQDEGEADAIANAGQPGKVTVATNMAGRGTDIKLNESAIKSGGLHVILTEFHESARVDRQLFGRSARQGDPGTVEAIVSLEDELFKRFAPVFSRLGAGIWTEQGKLSLALFRQLVRYAQSKSERKARKVRLQTMKRDRKWLQALGFVRADNK